MTGGRGVHRSAINAVHWMPVQQALLQGIVHACNNRVAALSGISQLYEAQLSTGDEGMQHLQGEIERMRTLMGMFRLVLSGSAERREPARMGEAMQAAASLLAYHPEARQSRFDAPAESVDVEPVLLWPGDAMRLSVLAFLAAGSQAGRAPVKGGLARVGGETVVSVSALGDVSVVRSRPEFVALEEAAAAEGGSVLVGEEGAGSVILSLALPGLSTIAGR